MILVILTICLECLIWKIPLQIPDSPPLTRALKAKDKISPRLTGTFTPVMGPVKKIFLTNQNSLLNRLDSRLDKILIEWKFMVGSAHVAWVGFHYIDYIDRFIESYIESFFESFIERIIESSNESLCLAGHM